LPPFNTKAAASIVSLDNHPFNRGSFPAIAASIMAKLLALNCRFTLPKPIWGSLDSCSAFAIAKSINSSVGTNSSSTPHSSADLAVDVLAKQDRVSRHPRAELLSGDLDCRDRVRYSHQNFGKAGKERPISPNPPITRKRQNESARNRMAIDRADHRNGAAINRAKRAVKGIQRPFLIGITKERHISSDRVQRKRICLGL